MFPTNMDSDMFVHAFRAEPFALLHSRVCALNKKDPKCGAIVQHHWEESLALLELTLLL